MVELIWEDPPPPNTGRNGGRQSKVFTEELKESLKAADGKWAVVIEKAKSGQVSNASAWAKRNPGFKTKSRTVSSQKGTDTPYRVYVRYVAADVAEDTKRLEIENLKREAEASKTKG